MPRVVAVMTLNFVALITVTLFQSSPPVPHNFWDLDLNSVIVFLGILIQGAVILAHNSKQHGQNQAQINTIMKWKESHEVEARFRDNAITSLNTVAAGMAATSIATAKSVDEIKADIRELRKSDHNKYK